MNVTSTLVSAPTFWLILKSLDALSAILNVGAGDWLEARDLSAKVFCSSVAVGSSVAVTLNENPPTALELENTTFSVSEVSLAVKDTLSSANNATRSSTHALSPVVDATVMLRVTSTSLPAEIVKVTVSPSAASPSSASKVAELIPLLLELVSASGTLVTPMLLPIENVAVKSLPSARVTETMLLSSLTV